MFFMLLGLLGLVSVTNSQKVTVKSQEVAEGSTVTFDCSFSGFGDPDVTWLYKKDATAEGSTVIYKYASGSEEQKIMPDGEKLGWSHAGQNAIRLSQADRSHSGEYTCLVQEGMNSGSPNVGITTGTLTVLVKPSPPRIIKPSDKKLLVGQAGEIVCQSEEGSPEPEYEYFKLDSTQKAVKLPADARLAKESKLFGNSSFTINDGIVKFLTVVEGDAGDYFCTAKNKAVDRPVQGETVTISTGNVSVASVVAIVFGIIFGVALLGVLGYIIITKLTGGGDGDSHYADSEVFEDGQADVMIGENYGMPSGSKNNRQEQSLVV